MMRLIKRTEFLLAPAQRAARVIKARMKCLRRWDTRKIYFVVLPNQFSPFQTEDDVSYLVDRIAANYKRYRMIVSLINKIDVIQCIFSIF